MIVLSNIKSDIVKEHISNISRTFTPQCPPGGGGGGVEEHTDTHKILHPFVLTSEISKINKSTLKKGCNENGVNLKNMGNK